MLRTLIAKEILETVLDLRFVVATVLFMVMIPLGMYISRVDYEQRLAAYQQEHQIWRQRYGTTEQVWVDVEAHGFRPPSVLSIFASGLDSFIPDQVVTANTGVFRVVKESGLGNVLSMLFGKADFLFVMTHVVSLMALILAFNAVSGERERGTLRLMIAHAVPRGRLLLAKVAGRYLVLLLPLVMAMLVSLIILNASPVVSLETDEVGSTYAVLFGITLLFVLGMVCLGICVSAYARHSKGAVVLLFFVWLLSVLGIPKITPMLAAMIHPVESRGEFDLNKQAVTEDALETYYQENERQIQSRKKEERDRVMAWGDGRARELESRAVDLGPEWHKEAYKAFMKEINEKFKAIDATYDPQVTALYQDYRKRTAHTLKQMEQNYRNRKGNQYHIAAALSRLSPVCCYAFMVTGLSNTGIPEPDHFIENAQRYQDQMEEAIYSKIVLMTRNEGGWIEGFDPSSPILLPDMHYALPGLRQRLENAWPDFSLLVLFGALFYALTFVRLVKYDVR